MTYIIYLRKSREDMEKEKRTGEDVLTDHRNRLVSLCRKNKYQYIIKEEIVSGDTISNRPVFQEVLYDLIPSGQYGAVVVNDITRLGRGNMADAGIIYQALIDYDIKVITPHKTYSPRNRADLRQIRFELFLSREEYELIKDRLLDGKDAAARAGRPAGNRWLLGLDSIRGRYVINKEELELAERVFGMIGDGHSLRETARMLNEMGHKTSRDCAWSAQAVSRLIHNPHYEGYQTWKGELIPAEHGSLLPPELIRQARSAVIHFKPRSRDSIFWVPLHCSKCGARMYGSIAKAKRTTAQGEIISYEYPQYFCSNKPQCYTQVKMQVVHDQVKKALWSILMDKKLQKKLIKHREHSDTGAIQREMRQIHKGIDDRETRLKKIRQDYIEGRADIGILTEARETLGRQIQGLQTRLRELEPKLVEVRPVKDVLGYLKETLSTWGSIESAVKIKAVREFTKKIEYDSLNKVVHVYPRLPL